MGNTIPQPQPGGPPEIHDYEDTERPSDHVPGTRLWTADYCSTAVFGMGVRSEEQMPEEPGSIGLAAGDDELLTVHPTRIMRPVAGYDNAEVCAHHFGFVVMDENGDDDGAFCGNQRAPDYAEEWGFAHAFVADESDPNGFCEAGDDHLLGAAHTAAWVEARFDSGLLTCTAPPIG